MVLEISTSINMKSGHTSNCRILYAILTESPEYSTVNNNNNTIYLMLATASSEKAK